MNEAIRLIGVVMLIACLIAAIWSGLVSFMFLIAAMLLLMMQD
jgi:hypothetical protein